ncbi:PlxyGVORF50-like protein [Hyphantria cunea granulovirus]|uniref:PlxyGVORF50-like protein n=1 Tax=Hyphantria cunea granulovirus TaxID=307448 RepID=A0AAF1D279_9BBAC|nr:PlxyGVORF50-like protein [Hyphantria cunea granulovirus]QBQ01612.1 PlxyGVORF50-like protein [Hyphantria cunea granulovirus]
MSFKDLYNEIIKTQQNITVTYARVVNVENELKKKLDRESNKFEHVSKQLMDVQNKLDEALPLFKKLLNNFSKKTIKLKQMQADQLDDDYDSTTEQSNI